MTVDKIINFQIGQIPVWLIIVSFLLMWFLPKLVVWRK